MKYPVPIFAIAVALLLSGCTIPTSPTTPSGVDTPATNGNGTSASTALEDGKVAAATELVRAGASAERAIASAPITANDSEINGGTLHVFSVRSSGQSTRLEWIITHPTFSHSATSLRGTNSLPNLPYLVAGGKEYRMTEFELRTTRAPVWLPISANQFAMNPDPRPIFAMYAPLPADVEEVEVRTPLISSPIKIRVERGVEQVPASSADVPILGRSVLGNIADQSMGDPLIITLHGLRRDQGGTVLYYSATFPAGAEPRPFLSWGGGSFVLNGENVPDDMFVESFGLIDRASMKGYVELGSPKQSCHRTLGFGAPKPDAALVCWVLFPPLETSTKQVDVIVGGKGLITSVPVSDGPMLPQSKESIPDLGSGWPAVPQSAWTEVTSANVAAATTNLRDVVTEGAVTQSGQQLDLDAKVLFDYNQATLTGTGQAAITQAVTKIKSFNKPGRITVTGHTDSDGDNTTNLDLSKRRAQAVADALQTQLGTGYTFTVDGKGETEPIAPNDTDAGKALNRRVTILPPQ